MPFYKLTAEHTQGKSLSHPCQDGVYDDPADRLDDTVEAESEDDAVQYGYGLLEEDVLEEKRCQCDLWDSAGSGSWWDSVHVDAEKV